MKTLYALMLSLTAATGVQAQSTPMSQMEYLDRGLVAIKNGANYFVSWRFLGTDDEDKTTFNILKNGEEVENGLYATNITLKGLKDSDQLQVVTLVDGEPVDTSKAVTPWTGLYKSLQLDRPTASDCTYTPNDCSVGDVDGDGEYELFLKWDPSNAKDNSQGGKTGNVYIDCYKFDGTKLWRVDLGVNIRAGAHYTQFLVYDFDGDGKAELICKTAPGTLDGQGKYVNQASDVAVIKAASNSKDWRNGDGRVNGGHEYLTVFEGATGRAINTIYYNPNRNTSYGGEAAGTFDWDDRSNRSDTGSYGNRGERYIATVAHLDGADKNASAVMCRGYYSYAFIWAVDFDGEKLKQKWLHGSRSRTQYEVTDYTKGTSSKKTYNAPAPTGRDNGSRTAFSNGNHCLTCADVDGDGCDEIVWGSCAIDNDGKLLYATGFGHGDAIHLGKHCPDRPGFQVFQVHEESPYGWDLHDAATGEVLHSATGSADNGRGVCADIIPDNRGSEFWSSNNRGPRSCVTGKELSTQAPPMNFRIYWDGDLQEELLDGASLKKWNGNGFSSLLHAGQELWAYGNSKACNGSKNTPCLQADIFGDWREELIYWDGNDPSRINIISTIIPTTYRVPTLMHDHTYRLAVSWQNSAYNQPPHIGVYLPDVFKPSIVNPVRRLSVELGDSVKYTSKVRYAKNVIIRESYAPDGTKKNYAYLPEFEKKNEKNTYIDFEGVPTQIGEYKFVFRLANEANELFYDTIYVDVKEATAIENVVAGEEEMFEVNDGQLVFSNAVQGMTDIVLVDASGRVLMQRSVNASTTRTCALPVERGRSYVVKIKNQERTATIKFAW